ncbi:MAG: type 4a pilus biogenesis protein PilO, partial [Candidatus Thiodiazotropha taylori]|nr:type 4a pilus biogenesis protein PilO [Candidatus Thiodiazotropha taylori]MCW4292227.1 type 4a pilus biogenesis protein PilO [Candidatus Thiodiazotropha taylori]
KEFYAELPIQIVVKGEYHEFGNFISGLAALPRIVTIHDIKINRGDPKSEDPKLMLEATAKTYRYLDEEEGE